MVYYSFVRLFWFLGILQLNLPERLMLPDNTNCTLNMKYKGFINDRPTKGVSTHSSYFEFNNQKT